MFGQFGGNGLSPLLASGLLKLDGHGGLKGWQWLFLREIDSSPPHRCVPASPNDMLTALCSRGSRNSRGGSDVRLPTPRLPGYPETDRQPGHHPVFEGPARNTADASQDGRASREARWPWTGDPVGAGSEDDRALQEVAALRLHILRLLNLVAADNVHAVHYHVRVLS